MKLSKQQIKQHEAALELLNKDVLSYDEKLFIYENWIPAYNNQIGQIASYFTPQQLANDLAYNTPGMKIIDLCAGIGMLSFENFHFHHRQSEITCIERNYDFVQVGKKLLPEANWICGDVLDEDLIKSLGNFDCVISNPPFGKIKSSTNDKWLQYKGSEFEYKVIEIGRHLSNNGCFILPQMSAPFRYSGERVFRYQESDKYKKFNKETGIELEMNAGFDTSVYKDDWVGTSIITEIALCDYSECKPVGGQFSLFEQVNF